MCAVLSCSVMSNSLWPHGCSLPSSSVHDVSPGKNTGVGCHASSRESSQPRIESRSPTLQVGSLPSEPPGKPKNTSVGCHFLLEGILPTQDLPTSPVSPALQIDSLPLSYQSSLFGDCSLEIFLIGPSTENDCFVYVSVNWLSQSRLISPGIFKINQSFIFLFSLVHWS